MSSEIPYRKRQVLPEVSLAEQLACVMSGRRTYPIAHPMRHVYAALTANEPKFAPFRFSADVGAEIMTMFDWRNAQHVLMRATLRPEESAENAFPRKRLQFLPDGDMGAQMAEAMLKKTRQPEIPAQKNLRPVRTATEIPIDAAQKALPAEQVPRQEPIAEEETENDMRELWRYETAMGRMSVKERFFEPENSTAEEERSVPVLFPTHQWASQTLTEDQWLGDMEDGEWKFKPIATSPAPF